MTNGLAEYIAQEEMGRHKGFWWSPDGKRLAFVRADSRHIPKILYRASGHKASFHRGASLPLHWHAQCYVQLGIVSVDGGPR